MKINIDNTADWQKLKDEGLTMVVDPMVMRCGELFIKGASNSQSPSETWDLLKSNLAAIGTFFDALILNDKLPVFNYGDTFDMGLNFDQRELTRINEYDEVLFDIDVNYEPYIEVKTAALSELDKVIEGPNKISQHMAQEIISELSKAEYRWNPTLERLEQGLNSDDDKLLAAFLLGGLIFGGYAQQMESEHLLQPKRSRLFLAVSLQAKSADYKLEEVLFEELKKKSNSPCEDLPWQPSFFPYLLSKADTPKDLLRVVVDLRRSGEVADYRKWLSEVMHDWKVNGRISIEKRNDVRAISQMIDRKLGTIPTLPEVEAKVTVADVVTPTPPGGLDFTPTLKSFWGWGLASLPGKRYRKLLTRAIVEDNQYPMLESRIMNVWNSG